MHVVLVDLLALVLIVGGVALAFFQGAVRRRWRKARGLRGKVATKDDASHYAMIISGIMIMAFGMIIAVFTTLYAAYAQG